MGFQMVLSVIWLPAVYGLLSDAACFAFCFVREQHVDDEDVEETQPQDVQEKSKEEEVSFLALLSLARAGSLFFPNVLFSPSLAPPHLYILILIFSMVLSFSRSPQPSA